MSGLPRKSARFSSRYPKRAATWGSSSREVRRRATPSARCAMRTDVSPSTSPGRSASCARLASSPGGGDGCLLFALRGDVAGRQGGSFAKEEVLHVLRDQLLRLFLPGHQAVLVQDHLHPLFPQLPGVGGNVVVDALSELARPRDGFETGRLALKFLAEHGTGHVRIIARL